jgi:hypothetical protein
MAHEHDRIRPYVDVRPLTDSPITRRAFLGAAALPLLAACTTPLPLIPRPPGDKNAALRLEESAEAHGLDAYRGITDISVSYEGQWRPLVNRIQPEVVDEGFRGRSQERLMPYETIVAQAYTGPAGEKQVYWRRGNGRDGLGDIEVWRNGARDPDRADQQAAALVAEGYGLFLLGPLWLVDRGLVVRSGGTERVDGRDCDVLEVWLAPGLGQVAMDRVAVCVDRANHIARRYRFTLEGTGNTKGAVAEVDTFDHERRFGVVWPMRSYERVVHPIRLPAHDWHVTGLDVNRGLRRDEIAGPVFTGRAAAPARPLQPTRPT